MYNIRKTEKSLHIPVRIQFFLNKIQNYSIIANIESTHNIYIHWRRLMR
jgi:hypothetical protein